jgi:hypothetical protein
MGESLEKIDCHRLVLPLRGDRGAGTQERELMTRLIRSALALGLVVAGLPAWAVAQRSPSTGMPAQAPEKTKPMTDAERGKLDAFLKQAVADDRRESLIVMIRLAAEKGADARVGEVLAKLGLKVSRTLSGGRLLVVTLKAGQLPAVAASPDVARVSFDALVTPQAK